MVRENLRDSEILRFKLNMKTKTKGWDTLAMHMNLFYEGIGWGSHAVSSFGYAPCGLLCLALALKFSALCRLALISLDPPDLALSHPALPPSRLTI